MRRAMGAELRLTTVVTLAACASVAACGGGSALARVDGGLGADGGGLVDGGEMDGGLARDGGVAFDGGAGPDAGPDDGGLAQDGGLARDGGMADGGDPCDGGLCPVQTVAEGIAWPAAVAVSATHVAWVGAIDSAVWIAPKTTLEPRLVSGMQLEPKCVALDATHVYWANSDEDHVNGHAGGALMRAPLEGDGGVTALGTGLHHPAAVAVDDAFVYWGDVENGPLWRAPKAVGLTAGARLVDATRTRHVVLDGAHIYWAGLDHTLYRVHRDGGATQRIADASALVEALDVDATHVYWSETGQCALMDGAIYRAPKDGLVDGGAPELVVALVGDYARGLIADRAQGRVVFTRSCDGALASAPSAGGSERVVAEGPAGAAALAADETHFYWTVIADVPTDPTGAVVRAPRPNP